MFRLVQSKYKNPHIQAQILLSKMDDKLLCLATKRYNGYRIGEKSNTPYDKYRLLLLLRKVINNRLCGDSCCDCIDISEIILATNKLLYNIC